MTQKVQTRPARCKHCGADGLAWHRGTETRHLWRLYPAIRAGEFYTADTTNHPPHACQGRPRPVPVPVPADALPFPAPATPAPPAPPATPADSLAAAIAAAVSPLV